jgi:hypothetical protein
VVLTREHAAKQASGRGLVLLPASALLVHQLRYLLTYGSATDNQLAAQGHAYLGSTVPWLVMLTAAGFGLFLARLARARRDGADAVPGRSFRTVWLSTSAGLVAIYAMQEALEALFATGHPGGLAGIFGHGGWWAVPAALAVGFGIACLLRVGSSLARLAARRPGAPHVRSLSPSPRITLLPRRRPLAAAAAGRAPPYLLVACC